MDIQISAETMSRLGIPKHLRPECSGSTLATPIPQSHRHGKRARTLSSDEIQRVLGYIRSSSETPASDELKFLLSCRAGLRAGEIAMIETRSLVDASGRPQHVVEVSGHYTKNKKSRRIPMHPDLREAVRRFRRSFPKQDRIAISRHKGRIREQSPNTVCIWFHRLYRAVGLDGCSSHSGRRTFITNLARIANEHGASLRDIQLLAGHSRLDTTERYIDTTEDLRSLVSSL